MPLILQLNLNFYFACTAVAYYVLFAQKRLSGKRPPELSNLCPCFVCESHNVLPFPKERISSSASGPQTEG